MTPTGSGRMVPFSPGGAYGPPASPFPAVRYYPFNGNTITIGGVQYQIPFPGVDLVYDNCIIDGVPGQIVAPYTRYYVYAFMDSGVMRLQLSTVGWRTDDGSQSGDIGNGVGIKLLDPSQSVVGQLRTESTGRWLGDDQHQNTSSFYNRVRMGVKAPIGQCSTSLPYWNEPNSNDRVSFVCWQDDLPEVKLFGSLTHDTMYGHVEVAIHVDGSNPPGSSIAVWDCLSAGSSNPFSVISSSDGGMTEGYHFFGVLLKTSSGTAAIRAGTAQLVTSPVPS
jgi:hypothetical protein